MKTFFGTNGFSHALVFGVCAYLSRIEQVSANIVFAGHQPAISHNAAALMCTEQGGTLCSKAELCPGGTPYSGGVAGVHQWDSWVPINDGPDEWLQYGANAGGRCRLHSDMYAPDPHPCGSSKDPIDRPDMATCNHAYLFCCGDPPPSSAPTDAPTTFPTTFPTKSPITFPPTKAPTTAAPTNEPTNAPTGGPCEDHTKCATGEKCKGAYKVAKKCRQKNKDCKRWGHHSMKRWGCAEGETCGGGDPTAKWGSCV